MDVLADLLEASGAESQGGERKTTGGAERKLDQDGSYLHGKKPQVARGETFHR